MLIKVMTSRNTERLISGVEDVDIHRGTFHFTNDEDLHNTLTKGPGTFRETALSPDRIQTFDHCIDSGKFHSRDYENPASGVNIKFIDYKKDAQWHRLAVECFAYICNDDGKTISKISTE